MAKTKSAPAAAEPKAPKPPKAPKSKIDLKQMFIAKGEYIAMIGAGLFLAILLSWGASRWSAAEDPGKIAQSLTSKAQSVHTAIASDNVRHRSRTP